MVQVKYRFQYPGDTADIPAEWHAPRGYVQPEFFYTVNVSGRIADSKKAKTRGVMKFVDDLTVQVVDTKSGTPYADQDVEIKRADGSTQSATTDGSGTVELMDIPPGPAKVTIPQLGAPAEEPAQAPDDCREEAAQPAEGDPPSVTVATGAPWQMWIARNREQPTG